MVLVIKRSSSYNITVTVDKIKPLMLTGRESYMLINKHDNEDED